MPIVTTTYRYKCPPRKRKPQTVQAPAIVTIDSKTWIARRGSRHRDQGDDQAAAAGQHTRLERTGEAQPSTPPDAGCHSSVTTAGKTPQPADDD